MSPFLGSHQVQSGKPSRITHTSMHVACSCSKDNWGVLALSCLSTESCCCALGSTSGDFRGPDVQRCWWVQGSKEIDPKGEYTHSNTRKCTREHTHKKKANTRKHIFVSSFLHISVSTGLKKMCVEAILRGRQAFTVAPGTIPKTHQDCA